MTVLVTGSGDPVTVVAHGLGAGAAQTRPLVGGVPGTRVFPTARARPSYDLLGRDLEQVADAHGATQALGVSMGAGALLSLLARRPDRFRRVVLLLPAALDGPRSDDADARMHRLAEAVEAQDAAAVSALVALELPADLHGVPGVPQHLAARTRALLAQPDVALLARGLAASRPVPDRALLAEVTAEVLLLAQEGDPLHPASVARDLAAVLPRARLVVSDRPGTVVRDRRRLRGLVGEFLGG